MSLKLNIQRPVTIMLQCHMQAAIVRKYRKKNENFSLELISTVTGNRKNNNKPKYAKAQA